MAEVFAELPETVASKLKSKIYDSKWENKSTTKKTWQDAVNTAFENTKGDLNILDGIEEDFREDAKRYMREIWYYPRRYLRSRSFASRKK